MPTDSAPVVLAFDIGVLGLHLAFGLCHLDFVHYFVALCEENVCKCLDWNSMCLCGLCKLRGWAFLGNPVDLACPVPRRLVGRAVLLEGLILSKVCGFYESA
jgi:hypothetical protein